MNLPGPHSGAVSAPGGTGLRLFVLLVLVALGSCRSVDAKVWNLRQVHDAEGGTRRVGRLRSDLQQIVLGGTRGGESGGMNLFGIAAREEKTIEDPHGVSLENLIELGEFDSDDPRTRALQVEMFGWLAVDDPYVLARERSLLELGPLGRRLGVTEPVRMPAGTRFAEPEEVGAALEDLVRAVAPAVRGAAPVAEADVEEACAAIDALVLDRAGLRRLISALTLLLYDGKAPPGALETLAELHRNLQRNFVAQTLADALLDPQPLVRAAALEAATVASDNSLPGLLQGALIQDAAETVRIRCLRLLERFGIPRLGREASAEEEAAYEKDWIELLVRFLRSSMEGPVTVAACHALGTIAGAPLETLRPEEWVEWWEGERAEGSS